MTEEHSKDRKPSLVPLTSDTMRLLSARTFQDPRFLSFDSSSHIHELAHLTVPPKASGPVSHVTRLSYVATTPLFFSN